MKVSNNINNAGNHHEKYVHGVQKPRGLENAAVQRNKHNKQKTEIIPAQSKVNINVHEKIGAFSIIQDAGSRANEINQKRKKIEDIYGMVKKDEFLVAKNNKYNKVNRPVKDDLENLKIMLAVKEE